MSNLNNIIINTLERIESYFSKPFVTAIIPAYNEEKTIAQVITVISKANVDEIIVVDDGSKDNTTYLAKKCGVRVITHKKNKGKGAAMRTGVENAKGNILLFIDADITSLTPKSINSMIAPVKNNEADFVKSYYAQYKSKTGTSFFLYRPLLRQLFNKIDFTHPVSGQICGRRSFFDRIEIRNDYGTDISILIDAVKLNQRIKEVCLGKLVHRKRDFVQVERIADEVIKAILEKSNLEERSW